MMARTPFLINPPLVESTTTQRNMINKIFHSQTQNELSQMCKENKATIERTDGYTVDVLPTSDLQSARELLEVGIHTV